MFLPRASFTVVSGHCWNCTADKAASEGPAILLPVGPAGSGRRQMDVYPLFQSLHAGPISIFGFNPLSPKTDETWNRMIECFRPKLSSNEAWFLQPG